MITKRERETMNKDIYLLVADVLSGINHDEQGLPVTMYVVAQELADAFKESDATFDRVQFLNDCEAAQ
jgi:hypothetical protein